MSLEVNPRPLKQYLPLVLLSVLYLTVYVISEALQFPIEKDELHFWPTALQFSHSFFPSLETLRSYNDLNTPLPFWIFGVLEYCFHQGIWAGRLFNFLVSFLCLVALSRRGNLVVVLGVLLCPYFMGVSTHLYTDIIAIAWVVLGLVSFERLLSRPSILNSLLTFACFALAIASRQYMVAFPIALVCFYGVPLLQSLSGWRERLSLLTAPALSALTLAGWFWFFGGPGPKVAIANQSIATLGAFHWMPSHAVYFLSCLGLYWVIPELLLFADARAFWKRKWGGKELVVGGVFGILFWCFVPNGNPPGYPISEMGLLDKATTVLGPLRSLALFALAALAVFRFRVFCLLSVVVWVNAVFLAKAHIGWDKYALPVLFVLWFLKAKPLSPPSQNLH